jgi:Uma2 family endonuclease
MSVARLANRSVSVELPPAVLPLEPGDHLTRAEFERRYAAMPRLTKAELIEGVVYVPSPVTNAHSSPHFRLIGWLARYEEATPGVQGGDNATIRFDDENEPQPDALLRLLPECGGRSRVDEEGYLVGSPEFVAEVAFSSASYDLHSKLQVYRRHGVREYLVWRVLDREIDWFRLRSRQYVKLPKSREGVFKSGVFPGLWLDVAAMLRGDRRQAKAVGERGLDSAAYARFAASLQNRLPDNAEGGQP